MKILLDKVILNLRWFPLISFIVVWMGVILIYKLHLFNIIKVDSDAYIIIYISLITTIAGYVLRGFATFGDINPNITKEFNHRNIARLIWLLSIFVFIGIYFSVTEIAKLAGGLNVFFENPFRIRQIVTNINNNLSVTPSILYKIGSYLINIGIISSFFAGILLTSKRFYFASLMPFVFAIVTSFIYLSRYLMITYLLYLFLSFIISYQFIVDKSNKIAIKKRLLFFTVGILLFVILLFIAIILARNFFIDKVLLLLSKQLYFYYSGGIATFSTWLHTDYLHTYGEMTFGNIFGWLAKFDLVDVRDTIERNQDFIKVAPDVTMNTYTYIKVLYEDFGLSGLVLGSAIWGYLTRYSVDKVIEKFTMFRLFWSVIFIMSFIMSFFGFYLQGLTSLFFRLILLTGISYTFRNYLFK